MAGSNFELNEQTLAVIHELGGHMPGGFFIYKADPSEELLYANRPVFDIYGCDGLEDFQQLTGYTFRGMVHPEDYRRIADSIAQQMQAGLNAHLSKPVEPEILFETLENLIKA